MVRLETEHRTSCPTETRFRELVENVMDVIYWTDDRGRFTFVNRATARLLRRTERDLLGRYALDSVAPAYREAAVAFYHRQCRERRVHTYFELPVATMAGVVWLGQNVRTLFDDNGTIVGFEVVARDITARLEIERGREQLIEELQMALAGVKNVGPGVALSAAS